jgi:uncharacterized protein with PIN domain
LFRYEERLRCEYNRQLSNLIREENDIQRFKIVQQNIFENLQNLQEPICPASAEFIAKFRLEHEYNRKIVNVDMAKEQIECTICIQYLETDEIYAIWPCPGTDSFHYKCMLEALRIKNTCPNCRHEVEGVSPTLIRAMISEYLTRVSL